MTLSGKERQSRKYCRPPLLPPTSVLQRRPSSKLSTSLRFVIILSLMVQGVMGFYAGHDIVRTCTGNCSKENRRYVLRSACSGAHLYSWPDALSKLPVADAEYISVTKSQCFETTRTGIRGFITELFDHHNGRFIWLRGSPGTGKTAIAKSIAYSLARDKRLAGSFFWDKTGSRANTNTIELFPSTLASQLATFSRDYWSIAYSTGYSAVCSGSHWKSR